MAAMPGGWEALHLLEATITSGNQDLDRLRFDIEDNKLTVGDRDLIVGTGATATSVYLRVRSVNGADVDRDHRRRQPLLRGRSARW